MLRLFQFCESTKLTLDEFAGRGKTACAIIDHLFGITSQPPSCTLVYSSAASLKLVENVPPQLHSSVHHIQLQRIFNAFDNLERCPVIIQRSSFESHNERKKISYIIGISGNSRDQAGFVLNLLLNGRLLWLDLNAVDCSTPQRQGSSNRQSAGKCVYLSWVVLSSARLCYLENAKTDHTSHITIQQKLVLYSSN